MFTLSWLSAIILELAGAVVGALVKEFVVDIIVRVWLRITGRKITIDSPKNNSLLSRDDTGRYEEEYDEGWSFFVTGRLRQLKSNHQIILITFDPKRGCYWPQLWYKVTYDRGTGIWIGRVLGTGFKGQIHAVVAPPSWIAICEFYQKFGNTTGDWSNMTSLPDEVLNRAVITVEFPCNP